MKKILQISSVRQLAHGKIRRRRDNRVLGWLICRCSPAPWSNAATDLRSRIRKSSIAAIGRTRSLAFPATKCDVKWTKSFTATPWEMSFICVTSFDREFVNRSPFMPRHSRRSNRMLVESLESRYLLHGEVIAPFSLIDVNETSETYQQAVSPADYLGQTSGWYFGHAT